MRRAYKFLLRPTSKQVAALEACLEDTRQLYNAALEERREAWRMGVSGRLLQPGRAAQGDPRRPTRRRTAGGRSTASGLRSAALTGHSRRSSAASRPGRSRDIRGSRGAAGGTRSSGQRRRRCRLGFRPASDSDPRVPQGHRPRPGPPAPGRQRARSRRSRSSARASAGTWSCRARTFPPSRFPATGAAVGIDMGIASFLTTSDGEHVPNPRHLAASADRLAAAQRSCPQEAREQAADEGGRARSPRCTARCAGSGLTTRTRPRSRWCATMT